MFKKGGGRTTKGGSAIGRKQKRGRQGSAASSGDTPAAKKQRRPNASAKQGGCRGRKRTATSQAADVTSDFYRCGLHFMAAQ